MYKELKIYKDVKPAFKLIKWERTTEKHCRLYFEPSEELQDNILIWAQKDLDKNDHQAILVVEYLFEDGSLRVRTNEGSFIRDLREFEPGELFLLIASFKDTNEEAFTESLSKEEEENNL